MDTDFGLLRRALAEATAASSFDARDDDDNKLPLLSLDTLKTHLVSSLANEKAQDNAHYTRTRSLVFGPGKHFSRADLAKLERVDLGSRGPLRIDTIAKQKVLVARICSTCFRAATVQFIVQDPVGRPALVHLYHISSAYDIPTLNQRFPIGGLVGIKEPNIRYSSTLRFLIRIDSPSDLVSLYPSSPLLQSLTFTPPLRPHPSPTALKTVANDYFAKKKFWASLHAYLTALGLADSALQPVLHSNIAATYLALSPPRPGQALRHAQTGLSLLSSPSSLLYKLHYRAAHAAYLLADHSLCASHLSPLLALDPIDPSAEDLNRRLALRRVEESTGEYDWPHLFRSSLSANADLDYAPYQSPLIHIAPSPSSGGARGLFARSNIRKGTLLFVARPLAHSGPSTKGRLAKTVASNLFSESRDPTGMVELVARLVERCEDEVGIRRAVGTLWHGEEMARFGKQTTEDQEGIDVSSLEAAATYNAFFPESLSAQTFNRPLSLSNDDQEHEDGVDAPSALYALPSSMNHACLGNVTYSFLSTLVFLRARVDLNEGDELRDSYLDPMTELDARREVLKKHDFVCGCKLCQMDEMDGEENRARRRELLERQLEVDDVESLEHRIGELEKTYWEERRVRPALYKPLRALSKLWAEKGEYMRSVEAEQKALESLGWDGQSGSVGLGDTNAVLSSLFIARSYQAIGQLEKSKAWIARAREIERGQTGVELFRARYLGWAEFNGLELGE